ncbi:MAG: hypothetical protein NTU73_03310 [Ignavibacteriae bacterium]|nr:hypothetical protein [Ignavibacteriota bacterium]
MAPYRPSYSSSYSVYRAAYNIELIKVERPENAKERYGEIKIDTVTGNEKYKSFFEDDLVKILFLANSRKITFLIENKTDHSIKILWDESAFIDSKGVSHRIMHTGIKYNDRENPQPPSVIARKGKIEDLVFPTDYVYYSDGWKEMPLFVDFDYHSAYLRGDYRNFLDFREDVNKNLNKEYSVLLPLQIENVTNDYIFTFKVNDIKTEEERNKN